MENMSQNPPAQPGPGSAKKKKPEKNKAAIKAQQEEEQRAHRELMGNYRQLLKETRGKQQDLLDPTSNELELMMKQSNTLHKQVTKPREAVLDAEFVSYATALASQQVKRMRASERQYSKAEFLAKLKLSMQPQEGSNESGWSKLGKQARDLYARTNGADFLYGALPDNGARPEKKAKRVVKERLKKEFNELEVAEEIAPDAAREEKKEETSSRVHSLMARLKQLFKERDHRPIGFFEFVLNPHDYGQSIENIFHLSFLIKNGQVKTLIDNQMQQCMVAPVDEVTKREKHSKTKATSHSEQAVVVIDYAQWAELVDLLELSEPMVPTRGTCASFAYLPSQTVKQSVVDVLEEEPKSARGRRGRKRSIGQMSPEPPADKTANATSAATSTSTSTKANAAAVQKTPVATQTSTSTTTTTTTTTTAATTTNANADKSQDKPAAVDTPSQPESSGASSSKKKKKRFRRKVQDSDSENDE